MPVDGDKLITATMIPKATKNTTQKETPKFLLRWNPRRCSSTPRQNKKNETEKPKLAETKTNDKTADKGLSHQEET